jgi:hypothetical protein
MRLLSASLVLTATVVAVACSKTRDFSSDEGGRGGMGGDTPAATGGMGGDAPVVTGGTGGDTPAATGGMGGDAPVVTGGTGGDPSIESPHILEIQPEHGAKGVSSETTLRVTFSVPMDTSSAEQALASSGFDLAGAQFTWSSGNTELAIRPNGGLPYAEGTDPEVLDALVMSLTVGTTAKSAEGVSIESSAHSEFSTLRRITGTLYTGYDATNVESDLLTGTAISDGTFEPCSAYDLWVGDFAPKGATTDARTIVTFDVRALPPNISKVESANLVMNQYSSTGSPFSGRTISAAHINAPLPLDGDAYSSESLLSFGEFSISSVVGVRSVNVAKGVEAAVLDRALYRDRFQVRLAFSNPGTDASSDYVVYHCVGSSKPYMSLTYLAE